MSELKPTRISEKNLRIHTDWQSEVIPGCYFVRFLPEQDSAIYGEVVSVDTNRTHVMAHCYSARLPQGAPLRTMMIAISMLLSKEQFELAQRLGWPADEHGLKRVFSVRPS